MADIGKNIKNLRLQQGLSQEALAEKLFLSRQTVSNYETGKSEPDIATLEKLAEALGTNIETIIYGQKPDRTTGIIRRFLALLVAAAVVLLAGHLLIEAEKALYVERYYYASGRLLIAFLFYPLGWWLLGMALGQVIHPILKRRRPGFLNIALAVTGVPSAVYTLVLTPFWAAELWGRVQMWLGFSDFPSNALLGASSPEEYTLLMRIFGYILHIIIVPFSKFFVFALPGFVLQLWLLERKNRPSQEQNEEKTEG